MTGVFYYKPDIILFSKFNPSCDIICFCRVDGVNWRTAQFTRRVRSYRGIDWRTSLSKRVGVSNWRMLLEYRV